MEIEKLIEQATLKLSEVAGLTKEQARDQLMLAIEKEYSDDLVNTITKFK